MNKKARMLALLAVFGILLVTIGATYAVFTYRANGETLSTIEVGSITFQYNEEQNKGHGISLENAFPVASNADAKESDDYFEFTINSTTTEEVNIPYTITARRSGDSDVEMGDIIDMYLTEVVSGEEQPTTLTSSLPKFNELAEYNNNELERVIYRGTIPPDYTGPAKRFRLRMWINQGTNMSGTVVTKYFCGEDDVTEDVAYNSGYKCDGDEGTVSPSSRKEMTSPYNDMSFKVTVNVYSTGNADPYIAGVTVDGNPVQPAPAGSNYDDQVTIPASSGNGDIVTQVNAGENVDVDVTRTDDTFTNPVDPNATGFDFMSNPKVRKISARNVTSDLGEFVATTGEWGDVYLRLDMRRTTTGLIISTKKVKITIEEPTATITPVIVEAGGVKWYSCNGLPVESEKSTCSSAIVTHETPIKKTATAVSGQNYNYELMIPKDTRLIGVDSSSVAFTGYGEKTIEYQRYTDDTFTTPMGDVAINGAGLRIEANATEVSNFASTYYVKITVKAKNRGTNVELSSTKVKLYRSNATNSNGSPFLSNTWYE